MKTDVSAFSVLPAGADKSVFFKTDKNISLLSLTNRAVTHMQLFPLKIRGRGRTGRPSAGSEDLYLLSAEADV